MKRSRKRPWAELARQFEDLTRKWGPDGSVDGRVFRTSCVFFAQICREADDTNYSNPEMMKTARLMKKMAVAHLTGQLSVAQHVQSGILQIIMDTVQDLERETGSAEQVILVKTAMKKLKLLEETEIERYIDMLIRDGKLYVPKTGLLKRTRGS